MITLIGILGIITCFAAGLFYNAQSLDILLPSRTSIPSNFLNLSSEIALRGGYFRSNYNTSQSIAFAMEKILAREGGQQALANISNVLAVVIIFSTGFNDEGRINFLKCSLQLLHEYVGKQTPLQVYLFVSTIEHIPSWFTQRFPNVVVMPLHAKEFYRAAHHSSLGNNATWIRRGQFSYDYYLMGRWRLTFMYDFVRGMGHKFLLQMDDDTFVKQTIDFDIVRSFSEKSIGMGVWRNVEADPKDVLLGLVEFTSYWMQTRGMATPRGDLSAHLTGGQLSTDAWDRQYYRGCFLVSNIAFWFDPVVQDYLQLLFKTGSDIEQRWQDQGVQNMIRLLFLRPEELYIFKNIDIVHGKPSDRILRSWGCQL